jgi:hypothetical protein
MREPNKYGSKVEWAKKESANEILDYILMDPLALQAANIAKAVQAQSNINKAVAYESFYVPMPRFQKKSGPRYNIFMGEEKGEGLWQL